MPSQVRIIRERNSPRWDELIDQVLGRGAYGKEHTYFGITGEERANRVRGHLRTSAKRRGAGSKVFYYPCEGCRNGGPDCRFHVSYTLYDIAEARRYKAQQAAKNR